MTYTIILVSGPDPVSAELPLQYSHPWHASLAVEKLREMFPQSVFSVLREGAVIESHDLEVDIESAEIESVRESHLALPTSFRRGRFGEPDLAADATGQRRGVWKPPNPDDRFD